MKPIEPGCLAIIVNSFTPENIGKTVRVIEQVGVGKTYEIIVKVGVVPTTIHYAASDSKRWLVKALQGEVAIARDFFKQPVYNDQGLAKDEWLMRIGDDSVQDVLKEAIENSFQNILKKEVENVE